MSDNTSINKAESTANETDTGILSIASNVTSAKTNGSITATSGNSKLRDSSAKIIFEDPILCAQFLSGYLDIPLLKNVQPEDIEDVTNRYVHLFTEERNSDVVKKVHIRSLDLDHAPNNADECGSEDTDNLPFYLISLIEHKSDIDYNVVMQVFRYMVFIWKTMRKRWKSSMRESARKKTLSILPSFPLCFMMMLRTGRRICIFTTEYS